MGRKGVARQSHNLGAAVANVQHPTLQGEKRDRQRELTRKENVDEEVAVEEEAEEKGEPHLEGAVEEEEEEEAEESGESPRLSMSQMQVRGSSSYETLHAPKRVTGVGASAQAEEAEEATAEAE